MELKCCRYKPRTSDDDDSRCRSKEEVRESMAKMPLRPRAQVPGRTGRVKGEELDAIRTRLDAPIRGQRSRRRRASPTSVPRTPIEDVYAEEAPRPDGTRS